ncbi:MAG: hypothetical protein LLF97_09375 [Planctomycetaceae bacterium]|nr:hypothetical protein [Planctomycetaceae bacterium]
MKAAQLTQRRASAAAGPGISLFPFLAVLICTMGALVPLLMAITRTAKIQAETAAAAKQSEQSAELKTRREDVLWRVEQLKQSRRQYDEKLSDTRLELGHLEDHARQLRATLGQYERTLRDLDEADNSGQRQAAQSQAELDRLQREIAAARQQLTAASQNAAGRKHSYAVVPYEGPNQTHRRPIYLECREDAVVLQPEGIAFTESDFDGPLGPGNPLAMTLRATREYLLSQRDFDAQIGEPYPMLLVRPEGIAAYYAARLAMKSWGFEFGYELVEDDWKLAYPPRDPRLAEIVRQVVATARREQERLIAAAPRHYSGHRPTVYRAAPGGGIMPDRGTADERTETGYVRAPASGEFGRSRDGTGRTVRNGAAGGGSYGVAGADGDGNGAGGTGQGDSSVGADRLAMTGGGDSAGVGGGTGSSGGSRYGTTPGGGYGGAPGSEVAGGGYSDGGNGAGAVNALRTDRSGVSSGGTTGVSGLGNPYRSAGGTSSSQQDSIVGGRYTNGSNTSAGSVTVERPEGYVVGQPAREQTTRPVERASSGSDEPRRMYASRPGEWQPSPELPPSRPDDKPNQEKEQEERRRRMRDVKSLAERRGEDWALRNASRSSVGLTRPICVECFDDRLVLISDRGTQYNKTIPLGARTASSVDPLISVVWEYIEGWGIAGRGMYWRPLLQIQVAPDAGQRYEELAMLLQDSGIAVERK